MLSTVERFKRLFRGRENAHGRYVPAKGPNGKKRVVTKREPVPEEMWESHLRGEGPFLGIVPITLDNTCYFGAIDLDDDQADHVELERRVNDLNLPLVVCRSKSGGAHLFLFLVNPTPAKLVVGKLKAWATALRLQNPADDKGRVPSLETFPKQVSTDDNNLGNWINLPYYDASNTQRYAVINGQPADLETFIEHAERTAITHAQLEATQADLSPVDSDFFKDGPPCLNALHERGLGEGERNQGLYNIGIYLKLRYPDDWDARLREYNDAMVDPPLPEEEIDQISRSLSAKDYVYKCSDLPIVDFCKKSACKKCKFGIDAFRQREIESNLPELTQLVKVLSEPPKWSLEVNGQRVDLTTDELMNVMRFRKVAIERLNLVVPLVKQYEWDKLLRVLMADVQLQEAPEDAGATGALRVHVRDFLELRRKSDSRDALILGKPWAENGSVYFRSMDLLTYLKRKNVREFDTPSELYNALRRMGAGHTQFNIKGGCVQVWSLPVPTDEQTDDLDAPLQTKEEF